MEKVFKPKSDRDEAIMAELVQFTARSFGTPCPVPFGAAIVDSRSGGLLCRARNAICRLVLQQTPATK